MLTRYNQYARRSFPAYERFDQEQKQHGVCHAKKAQGKHGHCSALLIGPKASSCQPAFDRAGKFVGPNSVKSPCLELLLKLFGIISSHTMRQKGNTEL